MTRANILCRYYVHAHTACLNLLMSGICFHFLWISRVRCTRPFCRRRGVVRCTFAENAREREREMKRSEHSLKWNEPRDVEERPHRLVQEWSSNGAWAPTSIDTSRTHGYIFGQKHSYPSANHHARFEEHAARGWCSWSSTRRLDRVPSSLHYWLGRRNHF